MSYWKEFLWSMAFVVVAWAIFAAFLAAIWLIAMAFGIKFQTLAIFAVLFMLAAFINSLLGNGESFQKWLLPKLKNWRGKAS